MAVEIPEASPENIVAVVDLVGIRPGATSSDAAKFADLTPEHAVRALEAGVLLGLLKKEDDRFTSAGWTTDLLVTGSTDQKRQVFRAHLERFQPFAYVRSRVLQGFDILQACREAKALFDLDPSPAAIRDVFVRWGIYARSLVGEPPTIDTSLGTDSPLAAVVDPILDTGAAAEEYLSDAVTLSVYIELDRSVRDNLVLGVRRFLAREETRSVGQPLGIAFEDFLRGIAAKHDIDVSTMNGMVEVATALRTNRKIAKKHVGLVQAVGALRTAIEHGIDNDEGKEWQVTAQGLRLLIAAVALAVKSIALYEGRGELDL